MKLRLLGLRLQGFKRFKFFEIVFGLITNIFGANRSGKSTMEDTFHYILFGTDRHGKSDFDIKTADKEGKTRDKVDVSVTARIEVDGKCFNIGRTLKEVWAPIKNSNETYLQKHRTAYMWNDIDMSQGDFFKKRDALIDKNLFKLLTSVTYFTSLTPEIQRNMLMSLIPNIDDNSILSEMKNKTDFLLKIINESEDFDNAKKSLAGKITRIKKELKEIQPRIDQSETLKPGDQDWATLNNDLEKLNLELEKIKGQLTDKTKVLSEFNAGRVTEQVDLNTRFSKLREQEHLLSIDNDNKKHELNISLTKLGNDKKVLSAKMKSLNEELNENYTKIESTTKKRTELLSEYKKQKESTFVFDVADGNCENCGKVLDNIDEIKVKATQKFEDKRTKRLNEIKKEGVPLTEKVKALKERNESIKISLIDIKKSIDELDIEIELLNKNLSELEKVDPLQDKTYQEIKTTYEADKLTFDNVIKPTVDNVKLLTDRANVNQKIDNIKALILTKKEIEKIDKAIEELQLKETSQVAEIMNLEADLYSLDQFNKLKAERLEGEVNKLFSFAKFKMFEHQMNGIDKPICKATFEGVTFASLNHEAQINAGLDIIKAFSNYHNVSCPIFIDNRESVTEIIDIDTQVINMIVNPSFKELAVNPTEEEIFSVYINKIKKDNGGIVPESILLALNN